MPKSEEQQAVEIIRQFENRLVWLTAMLAIRATSNGLTERCAKGADEVLDEYQTRFPPIQP